MTATYSDSVETYSAAILGLCDKGNRATPAQALEKLRENFANELLHDISDGEEREFTVLMRAARGGHLELVKDLIITHHAKVDLVVREKNASGPIANAGATALYYAAESGSLETVRVMLEHEDAEGRCKGKHMVRQKDVVERGPAGVMAGQRLFPINAAAAGGHTEVLNALLLAAFEVSISEAMDMDEDILSGLMKDELLELLRKVSPRSSAPKLRREAGRLGMDLTKLDEMVGLDGMMKAGIRRDSKSTKGWKPEHGPPLLAAVSECSTDVVQLLLSCGASLQPSEGIHPNWQPLYKAAKRKCLDDAARSQALGLVRLLLDAGAPPNPSQEPGTTALHAAVETGNAGTVDALLRAGANVDQQKKLDETALFVAVREIANPDQPQLQGQLRGIVGLLLAHGADIDLRGNIEEGKTKVPLSAFELACMNGDIEIAELLIRADAPDSVNKLKRLQGGKGERAKSLERPNGSAYVRLLAEAQRRDQASLLRASSAPGKKRSKGPKIDKLPAKVKEWTDRLEKANRETTPESAARVRKLLAYDEKRRNLRYDYFFAVHSGDCELVKTCLMLDGVFEDSKDGETMMTVEESGFTPFHLACQEGHVETVRLLVESNCDTSAENQHGQTGWDIVLDSRATKHVGDSPQEIRWFDNTNMKDLNAIFEKHSKPGSPYPALVKEKQEREIKPRTAAASEALKIGIKRLQFWDALKPEPRIWERPASVSVPDDVQLFLDQVGLTILLPSSGRKGKERSVEEIREKRHDAKSTKIVHDYRWPELQDLKTNKTRGQITLTVLTKSLSSGSGSEDLVIATEEAPELGQLLINAIAWVRGRRGTNWKILSAGAFGVVYTVCDIFPPLFQDGIAYTTAVVKAVKSDGKAEEEMIALTAEIETLAKLSHKHIVKSLGFTHGAPPGANRDDKWMLILEKCDYDLGYVIYEYEEKPSTREFVRLAKEIADGMEYIHEKGFMHLDLKPGNVLIKEVDGQPSARIADFGMAAKEVDPDHRFGTPEYMAPEAFNRKHGAYGKWSDVFSFSVILWEVLVGERPYKCFPGALPTKTGTNEPDMDLVPVRMSGPDGQRPTLPAVDSGRGQRTGNPVSWPLSQLIQACWYYRHDNKPQDQLKQLACESQQFLSKSESEQAEAEASWKELSVQKLGRTLEHGGYLSKEAIREVENQPIKPQDQLVDMARRSQQFLGESESEQANAEASWRELTAQNKDQAALMRQSSATWEASLNKLTVQKLGRTLEHGGYLSKEAVHEVENQQRPTFRQVGEVLELLMSIEGGLEDEGEVEPEPEPEPEPEMSYEDFLVQLDLQDQKEALADCGLDDGLELKQLREMDESDLKEDILDDEDGAQRSCQGEVPRGGGSTTRGGSQQKGACREGVVVGDSFCRCNAVAAAG